MCAHTHTTHTHTHTHTHTPTHTHTHTYTFSTNNEALGEKPKHGAVIPGRVKAALDRLYAGTR